MYPRIRPVVRKVRFQLPGLAIAMACLVASMPLRGGTPSQWTPRGPGGGGALFAPAFSPYASGELFMACDMSEVFHSTNFGTAWDTLSFRQIQGGRQAKVRFTSNPLVFYSIDQSGDVMTPTRSLDGGVTWLQLTNEPTDGGAYALFTAYWFRITTTSISQRTAG
jgi:hypothetical protein